MFRVEASTALTSDPVYIFSIDGVKFENFMSRDEAKRLPKQDEPQKRPSIVTAKAPAPRANTAPDRVVATNVASTVVGNSSSNSFDPFAPSSASASVDPFATPSAPADPFAPAPTAASRAFGGAAVDPFAPPAAVIDPFAPPAAVIDPFAPAPTSASAAFPTSAFETSGASNDPFFSGESTVKKPFVPPAGSHATFASQATNSAPARRQSAVEIMGDFAGMSSDLPPPMATPVMLQEPPKNISNSDIASQNTAPSDPWSSLVDLDLNKKSPAENSAQRRASINAGPALNTQLKGDTGAANNRRGSMPSMSSGEFNPFPPAAPPQNRGAGGYGGDPFAAAASQPYQQQPFGGQPQYGMGMGGGAAANPFGPGPAAGPAYGAGLNAGFGMGPSMGMGAPNMGMGGNNMGMGMGGAYGAPTAGRGYQQQPQSKSSLDSLDPFKM